MWLRCICLAARALSLVAVRRDSSPVPVCGLLVRWLLLLQLRALGVQASVVVAHRPWTVDPVAEAHKLSCPGKWSLPGPAVEPGCSVSPALPGDP